MSDAHVHDRSPRQFDAVPSGGNIIPYFVLSAPPTFEERLHVYMLAFVAGTRMFTSRVLQLEEEEDKDSFDVDVAVTNPEKVGQCLSSAASVDLLP